ncbi:MAG: outer-membrane lipoprotein carrier protein LolA [Hyphomonas sp.]|uniref:Outer membrane lipoprotein carrier protein LolA n=1 Tax=Hyphomonas atlantica TaxID=1280948 RepID=A0A353L584_9PROT|nr:MULTISPECIES: outer membrane lipoprotein carrier protein LolA [Hyphomonas]MAH94003.1 outer-membrane lipoprotein carrier protein LolA [Hyphomonas sp.]OUX83395.1 MAG: outer-membrane lipoprotein carrier protein LolA [Hyphomonas sp. TMED31]HBF91169.1 outer membrane lipoprotein carrier protein LolA [Hyphomonas atlantica]HBQ47823.1 outer membrane lipoprotein carrier protein LolA [Hyphomonas atlantica]
MLNILASLGAITAIATSPLPLSLQATEAAAPAPQVSEPAGLSEADRQRLLNRASTALAKVKTASGTFEQLSPDYSESTGRFALSRPGKVRFEYDDPSPLLVVSDGTTVGLQDSELETTDRVPLGTTPLALLLDDDIDFATEADVLDVTNRNGRVEITLRDKSGEMDGTLTLVMQESDMSLTGWHTLDSGGNLTQVQLTDVSYGQRLNPRLFVLKDFDKN